jgi:hypothetical protein
MRKRYPTQTKSLEARLAEHATRLRKEAKAPPSGAAREAVVRRAEQAEASAAICDWLHLPGLKSNA